MQIDDVKKEFIKLYGDNGKEIRTFYAPGRVNLIGEHTDYNGGNVFPCALSFGTYAVARKRDDDLIKFASTNFELKVQIKCKDMSFKKEHDWANYPKGIINEFQKNGFTTGGFEVLYDGSIPNGAGLSSSASIEMVTCVMLNNMFDFNMDMIEMVKLSLRSENQFIGVNCGIMDQFAIGMGRKGHAIFLNCATLEYEYVPVNLNGLKLVITNTNKRRGLADSKYNERRAECEKAVKCFKKKLDIKQLADIDPKTFEKYKYLCDDNTILKRATHVVYEIDRTKNAVDKLKHGDVQAFGKLMNESHISLRDLYEVTGIELDTLAEEAWKVDGVIGSRMTGAGFGGCTVSIVKDGAVEEFKRSVAKNYKKRVGLDAEFYIADIGSGACEI